MTLTQQNTLSVDPIFTAKVTSAAVTAAVAVMAEDKQTVGHVQRIAYATAILGNPTKAGELMVRGVVTNPSILSDGTSPDADIEFTVNSLFNAYAGVSL